MQSTWGETQHFYDLSPDKILDAVEDFGFRTTGRAMSLLALENRVYEVEIEPQGPVKSVSDKFVVAKFYRPGRWSAEQIQEEHDFLLELAELELPVIAPLKKDQQTLFHSPEFGLYYALYPKRGGRSVHELSHSQTLRLATNLARIHSVGKVRAYKTRPWLDAETYILSNLEFLLLSEFIPTELKASYNENAQKIAKLAQDHLLRQKFQRIHGDCHHGNILWVDDAPLFLDFDDTLMGPVVQDLWPILQTFPERELREEFLASYETFHSFNPQDLKLLPLLRAMRIIHYSAWVARRYSDPSFQRIFVNFKDSVNWQKEIFDLQNLYVDFINTQSRSHF